MKHIKLFEHFTNEAVTVRTNRYERSHGKKPRGFGQWAFYFDDMGGEPIWVPKAMSYSDAVKWAKAEAKKAGEREIYVGESVTEGEVLLFDELNDSFDDLATKISKLMDRTDDPKWNKALQGMMNQLQKLIGFAAKQDTKLGIIPVNEDKIPGGLSNGMSLSDIAKKHGTDLSELKSQFEKGVKVEMEHTSDKGIAEEIARDHLFEDPKYYDKLETIEKD